MISTLADAERFLEARVAKRRRLDPEKLLFGPQREFVTDPAKFKTAVCSRRAGKTIGNAYALLDSALKRPGSVSMYLTLDRTDAKQIVWTALLDLHDRHTLNGKPNEADLTLHLPNGSTVLLAGAGDERKVKKRRGLPLGIAIIDEAQNFSEVLQELVDSVLTPALMDYDGGLVLTGTPGPVPIGYFYECAHSPGWKHFGWTAFENPWIERKSGKTPQQQLEAELVRRGVTADDPLILREWRGIWALDLNSLVFHYSAERNHYDTLPLTEARWYYGIGIDVGHDDADAIAVLAWNDQDKRTWLIEEHVQAKQDVTSLAEAVRGVYDRLGHEKVVSMVIDSGGLGKKIAAELAARHRLPVSPAEKTEKQVHIELLNDALRTGRLLAKKSGPFARDAMLVEWDRDKSTPERRVVSDKFHSDIADAVLYVFRESLAWTSVVPEQKHPPGSKEWADREARLMFERAQREVRAQVRAKEEWSMGDWQMEDFA